MMIGPKNVHMKACLVLIGRLMKTTALLGFQTMYERQGQSQTSVRRGGWRNGVVEKNERGALSVRLRH